MAHHLKCSGDAQRIQKQKKTSFRTAIVAPPTPDELKVQDIPATLAVRSEPWTPSSNYVAPSLPNSAQMTRKRTLPLTNGFNTQSKPPRGEQTDVYAPTAQGPNFTPSVLRIPTNFCSSQSPNLLLPVSADKPASADAQVQGNGLFSMDERLQGTSLPIHKQQQDRPPSIPPKRPLPPLPVDAVSNGKQIPRSSPLGILQGYRRHMSSGLDPTLMPTSSPTNCSPLRPLPDPQRITSIRPSSQNIVHVSSPGRKRRDCHLSSTPRTNSSCTSSCSFIQHKI